MKEKIDKFLEQIKKFLDDLKEKIPFLQSKDNSTSGENTSSSKEDETSIGDLAGDQDITDSVDVSDESKTDVKSNLLNKGKDSKKVPNRSTNNVHRSKLIRIAIAGAVIWFGLDEWEQYKLKELRKSAVAKSSKKSTKSKKTKDAKGTQKPTKPTEKKENLKIDKQKKYTETIKEKKKDDETQRENDKFAKQALLEQTRLSEIATKEEQNTKNEILLEVENRKKKDEVSAKLELEKIKELEQIAKKKSETLVFPDPTPEVKKKTFEDQLQEIVSKVDKDVEIEVKEIVSKKDKTYVGPPNYLNFGRGLVYNCKGNHWACVDKDSYVKCESNKNWTIKNSKARECYNVNIYGNNNDCQVIQVYNINRIKDTDFCQGK